MSPSSSSLALDPPHLTLLDRMTTLLAWGLGGVAFLTVGWFAMAPDDPLGAVSLLTRSSAFLMLIQAVALAGIAAAIATLVAGRLLPDVGTFAAAAGLAAVSLRGGTAEALLINFADLSSGAQRSLALKLALESVGWMAAAFTALAASALVMRWCFDEATRDADRDARPRATRDRAMAGYDLPWLGNAMLHVPDDRRTKPIEGLRHTIITTAIGLPIIGFLSQGLWARSIAHGQTCFVVAAGVGIACYITYRAVPVRSAWWSILAVWLMVLGGYLWAIIRPAAGDLPPIVPSSNFLRVLPIQFIAVGTATAVAMFWYMYPYHAEQGNVDDATRAASVGHGER